MQEIDVVFPGPGQTTIICDEREAVMQDEHICWHLHIKDARINKVRIRFADTRAKFFKGTELPHQIEHHLGNGRTIWGEAPHYFPNPSAPAGVVTDKYTIEGLDTKDQPIQDTVLDPEIKTNGP